MNNLPHLAKSKGQLDPITFEVFRGAFEFIPARMAKVLQKSAFSPIIYDMVDFSVSLNDRKGQLVGQTANCPVHLASMHYSILSCVEHFGNSIKEGDVYVLNDPYFGGTHLVDVTFIMPIFYKGERVAFGVSRANWFDVGGAGPGGFTYTNHIVGEGLRIPPVKIVEDGKFTPVRDLLKTNTRCPQFIDGDMNAQIGSLRAAEQEIIRLGDKYGRDTLLLAMDELIDYTEQVYRSAIRKLPSGVYRGEDFCDSDTIGNDPCYARVKLTVKGDELEADFTGSSPQQPGGMNSPLANTYSCSYYSLLMFLAPDVPANAGMYKPVKIILPEDCWLNAKWPAPTHFCTSVPPATITSALWQALERCIPDKVIACTHGAGNWWVAAIKNPDTKSIEMFSETGFGGWGGTPYHDGMSALTDQNCNLANVPVESAELVAPLRYDMFELRTDTGGPGLYRGGLGTLQQISPLGEMELGVTTSKTRLGGRGARGGARTFAQKLMKVTKNGKLEVIGGWDGKVWKRSLLANWPIHTGESFLFVASGGGGWGDPLRRPPEKVLEDVIDEYVSIESAAKDYGVIIDKRTMKIDVSRTATTRNKLAKSKEYRKRMQGVRFDYLPINYRMYGKKRRK